LDPTRAERTHEKPLPRRCQQLYFGLLVRSFCLFVELGFQLGLAARLSGSPQATHNRWSSHPQPLVKPPTTIGPI
jgi:hypothetical protein